MAALPQYHWMTIAGPIFGFWYAFGIGANVGFTTNINDFYDNLL
jgi:hypothetical protein